MNINTVLIIIVIILAVGGGFWWYTNYGQQKQAPQQGVQINLGTTQQQ